MTAQTAEEKATVWILGAGFSRALGAPLFRDLFKTDLNVTASGLPLPDRIPDVLAQYRKSAPGGEPERFLWHDPEEFLDFVESARTQSGAKELIQRVTSLPVELLVDRGRRALAIECSQFLRGANPLTERWLPYLMWVNRLSASDTVVTFNYDRVFEVLKENRSSILDNGYRTDFRVIIPGPGWEDHLSETQALGCAPVLKLHGSVDWVAREGAIVVDDTPNLAATSASGTDLVLAIPGPGKASLRREHRNIGHLWRVAKDALSKAQRVVFLGYRFPPSDAQARVEILGCMKDAARVGRLTKVEIVLGPNRGAGDVVRMQGLVTYATSDSPSPLVHPLFVEDFLSMHF